MLLTPVATGVIKSTGTEIFDIDNSMCKTDKKRKDKKKMQRAAYANMSFFKQSNLSIELVSRC